jgi:hypothetical protein
MTDNAHQNESTPRVKMGWFQMGCFDLRDRPKFPLMFGIGCSAVLALSFSFPASVRLSLTGTLLAAVAGISGFLYAQHARDLQFFRELFREFNARYDALNDRLNEIRNRPKDQSLTDTDKGVLMAYFNLCAEESLYTTAGYIDSRVRDAWHKGMCYFDQDPEIQQFWKDELKQDSYYGFTLDCTSHEKV